MPLIRKGSSPRTIAANRANGCKATGPHGVPGNAGRLRHGILAKVDPFIMRELGEDPAEYAQLREAMLKSLQPQDAMEEALAEEVVDLLWRKRRLRRGEAGQQAEQRRTLKLERQYKLASEGKNAGASFQTKMAAHAGIVALKDSDFKFEYILLFLRDALAAAQLGEFGAGHLHELRMLYGPHIGLAAAPLIACYETCVQATAQGRAVSKEVVEDVCRNLGAEIKCFETLRDLYRSREISVPPSLLESRLLLSNKDSKKLNRYEMTLANQFYNALDRFMEYRRYRLTLGEATQRAMVNVEASEGGTSGLPLSAATEDASLLDDTCAGSTSESEGAAEPQDATATSTGEAATRGGKPASGRRE